MMIGVVLWSDPGGKSAVFWCEDQGDLAYFERKGETAVGGGLFAAGDMVQFDVEYEERRRCARNPHLLVEQVCQGLPGRLRQAAYTHGPEVRSSARQTSAKVIPLETRRAQAGPIQLRARKA